VNGLIFEMGDSSNLHISDEGKRMRIVKSGDQYAIAKGYWKFTMFLDLVNTRLWWDKDSRFYKDCWGKLEEVESVLSKIPRDYKTYKRL